MSSNNIYILKCGNSSTGIVKLVKNNLITCFKKHSHHHRVCALLQFSPSLSPQSQWSLFNSLSHNIVPLGSQVTQATVVTQNVVPLETVNHYFSLLYLQVDLD